MYSGKYLKITGDISGASKLTDINVTWESFTNKPQILSINPSNEFYNDLKFDDEDSPAFFFSNSSSSRTNLTTTILILYGSSLEESFPDDAWGVNCLES